MSFLVPIEVLMMRCLREVGENLSNHQVEVVELKLDHILCVFSGLKHLAQKRLKVPVKFDCLPITSVPASSVADIWNPVHSGLTIYASVVISCSSLTVSSASSRALWNCWGVFA
jgi:hypothetical protein